VTDRLNEIRERAESARTVYETGEWTVEYDGNFYVHESVWNEDVAREMTEEIAVLVAHAIPDIDYLLAEIERLNGKIADAWDLGRTAGINAAQSFIPFDAPDLNPYRAVLGSDEEDDTAKSVTGEDPQVKMGSQHKPRNYGGNDA
jgi:hypothetical protein